MKKIFTLILFFATIFTASAQIKIAYVTKGTATDPILASLQSTFTPTNVTKYDVTSSTLISDINAGGFNVIVVSEFIGSGDAGLGNLEPLTATFPMLFMKVHGYKVASPGWNWATSFDQTIDATTGVTVTDANHPIFAGVNTTGTVNLITAVSGAKGLTWANPATFVSVTGGTINGLAYVQGDATKQSILEIPVGTQINGTTIGQKFIQIGINSASYGNVSADGLTIITNAINYLAGVTTGIKNKMSENAFSIAPNPSNGVFTINFEQQSNDASVEVKSMDGRLVYNTSVDKDAVEVNLSHLTSGIYVVTYTSNNSVGSKKVVIK